MKTLFLFRHIVLTAIVFIVLGFLFQRYIPIKTYANHYPVRCETDSSGNRLFCPDGRLYVNHCEYACGTSPNECWSEPSCNAPIDCRDTIDPTRPIDSTSAYSTYCDSLTPQGGNDSCGIKEVRCATENGTCFSYYDACPTPTPTPASTPTPTPIPPTPTPPPPTPTPAPGTLSCSISPSSVASDDIGACPSDKYCVRLDYNYQGNGTAVGWPVNQNWNFGDGISGTNNTTFTTYHRYSKSTSPTNFTASLRGTETTGSLRSASCSSRIDVPSIGGITSTPAPSVTPTPAPSCGSCVATEGLSCDSSTRGRCSVSGAACTIPAQPCGAVSVRFFNEDCVTVYSGPLRMGVLMDDREDANNGGDCNGWVQGGGNQLFYFENPPNPLYCSTSLNQCNPAHNHNEGSSRSACDYDPTGYHPFADPGYSLDTAYLSTPNAETVCSTYFGDGDSCAVLAGCGSATGSNCASGATDNPGSLPRCFSGSSSSYQIISQTSPNWQFEAGSISRCDGTILSARDVGRAFSISAPYGYESKVIRLCAQTGGCDNNGWNRYLNPSGFPNGGTVVKGFTGLVNGYENYWASQFEKPSGSETTLAYDVCLRVSLSRVFGTLFYAAGSSTYTPYQSPPDIRVLNLLGPAPSGYYNQSRYNQQTGSESDGTYAFSGLPNGNSTLRFSRPIGSNLQVTAVSINGGPQVAIPADTVFLGNLTADTQVDWYLTYNPDAWIQTRGGDVHSDTSISLPNAPVFNQGAPTCSLSSSANLDFVTATALVSTPVMSRTLVVNPAVCVIHPRAAFAPFYIPTYDDLFSLYYTQAKPLEGAGIIKHPAITGVDDHTQDDIPMTSGADHLYYIKKTNSSSPDGNLTLTDNISGTQTGVVFVEGNLTIGPIPGNRFTYGNANSGIVLVVKGDVNIDPAITQVNAVIITQGTIYTAATAGARCTGSSVTASQLTINGSLISLHPEKSIKFCRTLNDNSSPSEVVNYEVKYLVILRHLMSDTFHRWSEIP